MKPQTPEEYAQIRRWAYEREAAKEPRPWRDDCLTFMALDDYAGGQRTLDETQLHHVRSCHRYCRVRFVTLAEEYGLTREAALAKLEQDYVNAVKATQEKQREDERKRPDAPSRSSSPTSQSPAGATPAFAGGVLSSPRKSADAAVDVQKAAADAFIWKRESGAVNGYLSFESSDGETVQPHVELKPPPGKTTFLFRYEKNGVKEEISLTIDSDGHSEPCADVPAQSLHDWELVAPDGELEWQAAAESPS
jgi:hypothetical protein